jgi:hypothetical protein
MTHRGLPPRRGWSLLGRPQVLAGASAAIVATAAAVVLSSPGHPSTTALRHGGHATSQSERAPVGGGLASVPVAATPGSSPESRPAPAGPAQPAAPASETAVPAPTTTAPGPLPDASIAFPLHTQGPSIVDASGTPVKLNLVNWYGTESEDFVVGGLKYQPIAAIIRQIVSMGFNGVRLPWSEQMWQSNPVVSARLLTANRQFTGERARTIFEAVVRDLVAAGLMVVLDNQASDAGGCCTSAEDTLWYTPGC